MAKYLFSFYARVYLKWYKNEHILDTTVSVSFLFILILIGYHGYRYAVITTLRKYNSYQLLGEPFRVPSTINNSHWLCFISVECEE